MNSPERKNYEIAKYCKNVIDNRSLMLGIDYNNLIVDLFREKLLSLHELEKAIKLCEMIYRMADLKEST